jgi:hypothetical protein
MRKILILVCLLNLGCPEEAAKVKLWHIEMINNTSIEINLTCMFKSEPFSEIEPFLRFWECNIEKGSFQNVRIITLYGINKLNSFISEIIISDSTTPIMRLYGENIDNKLTLIQNNGTDIYFRFEIKKEDLGVGINEGMNFEEKFEENDFINW